MTTEFVYNRAVKSQVPELANYKQVEQIGEGINITSFAGELCLTVRHLWGGL